MTHLNFKTIAVSTVLAVLFLAAPVQSVSAGDRTSIGFSIGFSNFDSYPGRWHGRDYYRDRHYDGPRYNYPRRGHGPGWDYSYRQGYYGNDAGRIVATAVGVFFGALIVSELVRYMNDVDMMRAREANTVALTAPIGSNIAWNNPQSYNYGTVIPTRDGYSESGRYCREFYQTVTIDGRDQDAYGVACQNPDGSWQFAQ